MAKTTNLTAFVQSYQSHKPTIVCELELCREVYYSDQFTITEKAEVLLLGCHQWWFNMKKSATARKDAIARLASCLPSLPTSFRDFEDVHSYIRKAIFTMSNGKRYLGIGVVTSYDVALRLAYVLSYPALNLMPIEVYLHAGAAKGYHNLESLRVLQCADMKEFSTLFPGLTAWEIEDLLCIYKDAFPPKNKTVKSASCSVLLRNLSAPTKVKVKTLLCKFPTCQIKQQP